MFYKEISTISFFFSSQLFHRSRHHQNYDLLGLDYNNRTFFHLLLHLLLHLPQLILIKINIIVTHEYTNLYI